MIVHMRHMGNSGKTAIGAILAALALLVLTGITLNGTVLLWFIAASAVAYVTCVAVIVHRGRNRTLAASGVGSILFIAFGIAFLRQWGLAFTSDPEALSTPVDSAHPDLYFYLAAVSGALTLLLLFAGAVLPGRTRGSRSPGTAPRRRPATAARGAARGLARGSSARAAGRPAAPRSSSRTSAGLGAANAPSARSAGSRSISATPAKRPATAKGTSAAKPAAKPATRQPARTAPRR